MNFARIWHRKIQAKAFWLENPLENLIGIPCIDSLSTLTGRTVLYSAGCGLVGNRCLHGIVKDNFFPRVRIGKQFPHEFIVQVMA